MVPALASCVHACTERCPTSLCRSEWKLTAHLVMHIGFHLCALCREAPFRSKQGTKAQQLVLLFHSLLCL
ncbi:hypothetical protein KP509_27G035400 [Ceratopteris richardii]|uniref:Uncharacterized protein n=1 Tax=Ceratopteris richardii TaxID=49495 RepID=A0A8T2RHU4_CERRI|nr:hypothetical protein KP509_27G035400 [Ceratopteris richardii]